MSVRSVIAKIYIIKSRGFATLWISSLDTNTFAYLDELGSSKNSHSLVRIELALSVKNKLVLLL